MNSSDVLRRSGQKFYKRVLSNDLTVCMFPKPGFQKKFAMYAVNFGSQDSAFEAGGENIQIPAGMAHFLEHKVFEQKDGDALQKFSAIGSSPNAFTSQTMTAYHFECTERFFDNLKILLSFVNNPYFTEQNVQKEQGIIGQEIGMVNDNADWRAYTDLFACMYNDHTIRESIIGTTDSIAQITPEILYRCHDLFYRPSNMVLVVAGDVDFDRVCQMAEEIVPKKSGSAPKRIYSTGDKRSLTTETSRNMEVSIPVFMSGYRDTPPDYGVEREIYMLTAQLAAEYLCGQSSPLFSELYSKNLLERDFGVEYASFAGGGMLIAGGESREPHAVYEEIIKAADRVRNGEFDSRLFERLKRASYGMRVRCFDSPETMCHEQAAAHFYGTDFTQFAEFFDSVTDKRAMEYIAENITDKNSGISVVYPMNRSDGKTPSDAPAHTA